MNTRKKTAFTLALITVLAIGLVGLSSWKRQPSKKSVVSDTTRRSDKKNEGHYSRKTIITIDENGKPHEEVIENFEGDEGLRELFDHDFNFEFNFPAMPDLQDFDIDIPDFPGDFTMPPMPPGLFDTDSLEYNQFGLFNENFEVQMQDQFENFGPQIEAEMEAMREQLEGMEFDLDTQLRGLTETLDELSNWDEHINLNWDPNLENLEELSRLDKESPSWEDRVKDFETAARQELVKDGYFEKSEKIESMSWSDDDIKFNGKPLKEEHRAKYQDLRSRYLKKKKPFLGRPE